MQSPIQPNKLRGENIVIITAERRNVRNAGNPNREVRRFPINAVHFNEHKVCTAQENLRTLGTSGYI